jgi:hypothetical protein
MSIAYRVYVYKVGNEVEIYFPTFVNRRYLLKVSIDVMASKGLLRFDFSNLPELLLRIFG